MRRGGRDPPLRLLLPIAGWKDLDLLSLSPPSASTTKQYSPSAHKHLSRRTELVWCTKREASAEAYPALRHLHEGSGRQGVFLLGKINPGQLMMLPEAESVWEITPFGQSWTQAAQVIPPIVAYPEPFVSALLQVILEGRLMTGERLSWSYWLQHYPPAPQHVYTAMPCRVCQVVRHLPLFSLMSAPSHTATFVCSGVACECNVPNTDIRPWVAWERTTPLVYSLTNEAVVPQSSSIAQVPAASSTSSQPRTRRSQEKLNPPMIHRHHTAIVRTGTKYFP